MICLKALPVSICRSWFGWLSLTYFLSKGFQFSLKSRKSRVQQFLDQRPFICEVIRGLQPPQVLLQFLQVDNKISLRWIIICVPVRSFEVDQSCDPLGMPTSD